MGDFKLEQPVRGLARLHKILGREDFVSGVFKYLTAASIHHRSEGQLYVLPASVNVDRTFFHEDVNLTFRLVKELPDAVPSLVALLRDQLKNASSTEYYLKPDTTITGEQVLFFTFTSRQSLQKNWRNFELFVQQSYLSPERIADLDSYHWERLASVPTALPLSESETITEDYLRELWQRIRVYTYYNFQSLASERPKSAADLDQVIKNEIIGVVTKVGRPISRLESYICQRIAMRLFSIKKG